MNDCGYIFLCAFAPGDSWPSCRDLDLSLSFVISSITRAHCRYRIISTTSLRGSRSPSSTPSALPASVPAFSVAMGYEYYSVQQPQFIKKLGIVVFFSDLIELYRYCVVKVYSEYEVCWDGHLNGTEKLG